MPALVVPGAHPLAGLGVTDGVLVFTPVVSPHAIAAFVGIGAFAFVRPGEDSKGAVFARVPFVAKGDCPIPCPHLARGFSLLGNRAKFNVFPFLAFTAGWVGTIPTRRIIFPPLRLKGDQESLPMGSDERTNINGRLQIDKG